MVTECALERVELEAEDPYAVVVPYFTCEEEAWSVVHVITAEVLLILPEATAEITGGFVSVAKVRFEEMAELPDEFADQAA
jgi:hypothetical protein